MRTSAGVIGVALLALACPFVAQDFHPDIPRTWDETAVRDLELPLARRERSPRYMTAEEYYALKVRPVYRSYPVYVRGKEPPGYIEWLKQREPEIIFDPSSLRTKEDWIKAGSVVFQAPIVYSPARLSPGGRDVPSAFAKWVSSDGVLSGSRTSYVIRKKGVVETGSTACSACHTRLMPDGSFIEGAQGNYADGILTDVPPGPQPSGNKFLDFLWINFGTPWIQARADFDASMLAIPHADQYPGVLSRQGTSASHPPHIPSLIGVQDIKYLDSTGLVRHRSIGDLMRYAAINTGLDTLAHYGDFQPATSQQASGMGAEDGTRYSDEQLYALALFIYSLKPPGNPNPVDDLSRRGERIFRRECVGCHTPPLYTNNKLTPATGFSVPADLRKSVDVIDISVGTDPLMATQTRRGTGFYKVPSLRGVWFRNGFGHGGNADSLEEWLDPARLKEDYVPKGYHRGHGPILGHPFGLKLPSEDKHALIAFLKTL
jgi:mono/diheme cytochrome c family protein